MTTKTPTPATPAVRVTFAVTVEMTLAQRDTYAEHNGVENVSGEIVNRLRPEINAAIRNGDADWLQWMTSHSTVTVSRPSADAGLEYDAIIASGRPTGKGGAP
jgi:hypothetical protein